MAGWRGAAPQAPRSLHCAWAVAAARVAQRIAACSGAPSAWRAAVAGACARPQHCKQHALADTLRLALKPCARPPLGEARITGVAARGARQDMAAAPVK